MRDCPTSWQRIIEKLLSNVCPSLRLTHHWDTTSILSLRDTGQMNMVCRLLEGMVVVIDPPFHNPAGATMRIAPLSR